MKRIHDFKAIIPKNESSDESAAIEARTNNVKEVVTIATVGSGWDNSSVTFPRQFIPDVVKALTEIDEFNRTTN